MPARQLHLVPPAARAASCTGSDLPDLALTAFIFALGTLPLVCDLAGVGRWSGGSLGLGTAGALLSGRELLGWLLRARSRGIGAGERRAQRVGSPLRAPRA